MPASERLRRLASHLLRPVPVEGDAVDLLIKGAQVVDGTGKPPFVGDLAVKDGKICFIGPQFSGQAKEEVHGAGKVLTPGFLDIHTHYDTTVCWDGRCDPSPKHGVTTVVFGNCSLGVAPCKNAHDADRIIGMFGCIEDIKKVSFHAGVPFDKWQTFPQYLDYIRPNLTINVGALVGHSLVRLYVMGEDCQKRTATPQEIQDMAKMVEESMEAGALGVSSSHLDFDEFDRPVPARFADMDEKIAIAKAMERGGRKWAQGKDRGVWEIVPQLLPTGGTARVPGEAANLKDSLLELGELSRAANITTTFQPLMTEKADPLRKKATDIMDEERGKGARIYGQTTPRDFDMGLRLSETGLGFMFQAANRWGENMKIQDPKERLAAFANPEYRSEMVDYLKKRPGNVPRMVVREVFHPENQNYVGKTVREIAQAEGRELGEVVLDMTIKDELRTEFWIEGRINMDKQAIAQQLQNPNYQLGASDAGAHITQMCGNGDTTMLLETFVKKDKLLPIEVAIQKMTGDLAKQFNIHDRGTLEVGKAADLVMMDFDKLRNGKETFVQDMPGGQNRYTRPAEGYSGVWVNGARVLENDQYTSTTGCGKVV